MKKHHPNIYKASTSHICFENTTNVQQTLDLEPLQKYKIASRCRTTTDLVS
jgi:hypothetical protein